MVGKVGSSNQTHHSLFQGGLRFSMLCAHMPSCSRDRLLYLTQQEPRGNNQAN